MSHLRRVLPWLAAGVLAAATAAWLFPRAFPLFPRDWRVSAAEAEAIALERLRDLGELPDDPYILRTSYEGPGLEERLQRSIPALGLERLVASPLAREIIGWEVRLYARGASSADWSHRARIAPGGEVIELRMALPPGEGGGGVEPDRARALSDAFLAEQGLDLAGFEEPQIRSQQLEARTDLSLRYRDRERILGERFPYGIEVTFAGDRLAGYSSYFDDPERSAIEATFQPFILLNQAWIFIVLLLLPVVAIPFVRRYHAGEIGVRRGVHISAVVVALGALMMVFCARAAGSGWTIGALTRQQVTWVVGVQLVLLFFFPMGLMAFLSWSVGESLCRERWSAKLAAFDALFKGEWNNATFARAALRGTAAGLMTLAALWGLAALLRGLGGGGVRAWTTFLLGPWWLGVSWFSVPLIGYGVAYSLYTGLFGRLLMVSAGVRAFGMWAGSAAAVAVAALIFFPPLMVFPFGWNLPFWILPPVVYALLFLRYGLFTSLLASLTLYVTGNALPLLFADDPSIQIQASLALLLNAVPLLVSFRSLASDAEFVYRYEDVPSHVRRIAERERQRVELETARGIQSAILPDLPPQLNGVEIAHAYLPASEVGGDFYDVLALEDGRLALAVGDVAGHGVSSGLVMSMAKSALAVQVTFDPDVESVFRTLNRMVYQSARRRLLTTLCYALLDPRQRRLEYASAGHLFPYRVTASGSALALESVSYPLGVRGELQVRVRAANLDAGDVLVLFSDGVVEARAEGSDELFGFDRFEASLRDHAGKSPSQLRDGVLEDIARFTRNAPREDDLTLLVLRVP